MKIKLKTKNPVRIETALTRKLTERERQSARKQRRVEKAHFTLSASWKGR